MQKRFLPLNLAFSLWWNELVSNAPDILNCIIPKHHHLLSQGVDMNLHSVIAAQLKIVILTLVKELLTAECLARPPRKEMKQFKLLFCQLQ